MKKNNSDPSLYSQLYEVAKARDKKALSKISGGSNYHKNWLQTPYSQLAKEDDHEGIEFLLSRWPTQNCKDEILFGYALNGNIEKAKYYIALGGNVGHAIIGFILGEHNLEEINDSIKKGQHLDVIVFAYAMKNDIAKVDELIQCGADSGHAACGYSTLGKKLSEIQILIRSELNSKLINQITYGYVLGDYREQVEEMIFNHGASYFQMMEGFHYIENGYKKYRQATERLQRQLIQFAQEGRFDDLANAIKNYRGDDSAEGYTLSLVMLGYAIGGYREKTKKEITNDYILPWIVAGYAIGGHDKLLTELLQSQDDIYENRIKKNIQRRHPITSRLFKFTNAYTNLADAAFTGYLIAGNKDKAMQIKKAKADVFLLRQICNELGLLDNQEFVLQLLSLCDEKTRKEIIDMVVKTNQFEEKIYGKTNNIPDNKVLNIKSARSYHLRNDYSLSYDQAQAWTNVPLQIWILQGIQLVQNKKLPFDIFLQIAILIPPVNLTLNETHELYNKFTFHIKTATYQSPLIYSLDKYSHQFTLWNKKHHKPRAISLKEDCKTASKKQIHDLLEYQLCLFDKKKSGNQESKKIHEQPLEHFTKDEYYKIVEKHHKRTLC